jgi:glucose/arabinose dehydrogenase
MHRRQGVLGVVLLLAVLGLAWPSTASAERLVRVARNLDQLTQVTAPRRGDRAGVLYAVEQEGQIWRRLGGRRTLFLDIRGAVSCCGERGLLSLAFDPSYGSNRFVYVNYTNNAGNTRVVRYRANAASTRVIRGSGRVLLRLDQPYSNHNGGQLAFGPNGRLYDGQGDGGSGCDPGNRAQNLRSRHGKLLSIDPRRLGRGWRIDGYGLRNPWRFSFDRRTGRLYIGDVGEGNWEEISTRRAALLGGERENYGWKVYEGRDFNPCGTTRLNQAGTLVRPISVYSHSLGCSVTGGFAYRGRGLARSLRGWYYFADYCSGRVWRLLVRNGRLAVGRRLVRDTGLNITSFGEGVAGELYVATGAGSIYRIARS